ncbi:hypothetical protein KKA17_07485 [bacterium]|nr:hypothetical protein [bacterium]MBU1883231.1 hypothetical protein [bacterium]
MKKLILISVMLSTVLFAGMSSSEYKAQKALDNLDCEFEDCPKEPQVKIIEKTVIVEKPVIVEKEVVKEVPVYKEQPTVEKASPKQDVATSDITFNKAFFDIHTNSQAPIQDYISFSPGKSFDIYMFTDSVNKVKVTADAYIYGNVLVPDSITTDDVYMYVGEKYNYETWYWKKHIAYNNGQVQESDYALAKVQKDNKGRRYVAYKISIHLYEPWRLKTAEENVNPNTFFFKMAPNVRGFKSQFLPAEIYINNEG